MNFYSNIPEECLGACVHLAVSDLSGPDAVKMRKFVDWVNKAYFNTSVACKLYNLCVVSHKITADEWIIATQSMIRRFAQKNIQELLR